MVRQVQSLLVLGLLLITSGPVKAGVLTNATWIQTTTFNSWGAGFALPMTRTFDQLSAEGGQGTASLAVALSYPQFTTSFFAPKTANGTLDLAVRITQGGPQFIVATPAMASLRTSQGGLPVTETSTTPGIPGVPGTVVVMSAVHEAMGVNQSMFRVGTNTLVRVPLSHGKGKPFTGTFIVLGIIHTLTADFAAWTPGSVMFTNLTSRGAALPNVTAAGSWMPTSPGGAGAVTLVAPTKISIDGALVQRRTASFTSLKLSFDGSSGHDLDGDNVIDLIDICPGAFDPDQADTDANGVGDACNSAEDADGDEWADVLDRCPGTADPSQADSDGNGVGDACNSAEDPDGDERADALDVCPGVYDPLQADRDGNGIGDTCNDAEDADGDDWADGLDKCPSVADPSQADIDHNGLGDACNESEDADGDDRADVLDNCPSESNANQADADRDLFGDVCDPDPDDPTNRQAVLDLQAELDACQEGEPATFSSTGTSSSCGLGPELAPFLASLWWLRRARRRV